MALLNNLQILNAEASALQMHLKINFMLPALMLLWSVTDIFFIVSLVHVYAALIHTYPHDWEREGGGWG